MKRNIKNIIRPFYSVVKKTIPYPFDLYSSFKKNQLSAFQKQFTNKLSYFKPNTNTSKSNDILLVQMVWDYEYTLKFAAASKLLAEKNNLAVQFYDVEIDWMRITKKTIPEPVSRFKNTLDQIHLAFGNKIAFRNSTKYIDQDFIQTKLKEILSNLNKNGNESLLTLQFEEILVGDLIYDTYLRFFHKPTITAIDNEVTHTIEVALNLFYNFKEFLKTNKVNTLLNTYTSYIHHGIPARLCLHNNIKVFTLSSHFYQFQKATNDFPYHVINHSLFSPGKKLSAAQLKLAEQKFTGRFSGKIDAGANYMRQSSFSSNPVSNEVKSLFLQKNRNIIIYAHDLYDSPHVYRRLQFPDLFQFLKQTLEELQDLKDTSVFIKIHPNGMEGSKEKTIELVNSFKKDYFHVLDETVSNSHIIELKPDLICTARGTVGIEMAYFEIPTVALYDNPYVNFNFVHTCYDLPSYFSIIKGETQPKIDFNKEKIYSFYYQAYLEQAVLEENNIFSILHSYGKNTYDDTYLEFILSHKDKIFCSKFLSYYNGITSY